MKKNNKFIRRAHNKGIAPIIIVIIVAVLIGGGVGIYKMSNSKFPWLGTVSSREMPVNENLVGGDRDSHGCIGSAGYSWCEAKAKCLRVWEERCEVATTTSAVDTKDWKIYRNEKYGFELKYPKGWDINDRGTLITLGNPSSGLKVFHFSIFIEDNLDKLSAQAYAENFVKNRRAEIERDGGVGVVRYDREFATKVGVLDAYELESYFNFDQSSERLYLTHEALAFVFEFPVAEGNDNLSKPIENNALAHSIISSFKFTK